MFQWLGASTAAPISARARSSEFAEGSAGSVHGCSEVSSVAAWRASASPGDSAPYSTALPARVRNRRRPGLNGSGQGESEFPVLVVAVTRGGRSRRDASRRLALSIGRYCATAASGRQPPADGRGLAASPPRGYGRGVSAPRFLTDDSLALVARRLRALGFDVQVARGARLDELFDAAASSGATVLTLSDRRPGRRRSVPVITLPRGDPAAAVRALASHFDPAGPPFGRCLECNTPLQSRFSGEALGEVPAGVARSAAMLRYCPGCGRWYWEGSHTARLREWLEAAIGRPLAGGKDSS